MLVVSLKHGFWIHQKLFQAMKTVDHTDYAKTPTPIFTHVINGRPPITYYYNVKFLHVANKELWLNIFQSLTMFWRIFFFYFFTVKLICPTNNECICLFLFYLFFFFSKHIVCHVLCYFVLTLRRFYVLCFIFIHWRHFLSNSLKKFDIFVWARKQIFRLGIKFTASLILFLFFFKFQYSQFSKHLKCNNRRFLSAIQIWISIAKLLLRIFFILLLAQETLVLIFYFLYYFQWNIINSAIFILTSTYRWLALIILSYSLTFLFFVLVFLIIYNKLWTNSVCYLEMKLWTAYKHTDIVFIYIYENVSKN